MVENANAIPPYLLMVHVFGKLAAAMFLELSACELLIHIECYY
jgi:hypothetical protein